MGHLKDCNDRYGKDTVREIKLRLIGGTKNGKKFRDHLIWTPLIARYGLDEPGETKFCKPRVSFDFFNETYSCPMYGFRDAVSSWGVKAEYLYEHWLAEAGEYERMIAYVNHCPVVNTHPETDATCGKENGHRVALLMFDIDCHHGQTQESAEETAKKVSNLLDMSIYWEDSTSGLGKHGYALFGWPVPTSFESIRSDISLLQEYLSLQTQNLAAPCNEIKGAPMILSDRKITRGGTWAKVPRPQTKEQAEDLLRATNECELMRDALRKAKPISLPSPSTEGNKLKSIGSPLPISGPIPGGQPAPRKHSKGGVESMESTVGRLKTVEDTYHRCMEFIYRQRPAHAAWSESDAWKVYQSHNLDIGNSDHKCFTDAWAFSEKSWDASRVGQPRLELQAKSNLSFINEIISQNGVHSDLEADYQHRIHRAQRARRFRNQSQPKRDHTRRLTPDLLAQTYTQITRWLQEAGGEGTIGKNQVTAAQSKIFKGGMNGQRFRAVMMWFRRNHIFKLVDKEIVCTKGVGRCRIYKLGIAHPDFGKI